MEGQAMWIWASLPDPALLAGRRGAADHLGPGRHPRARTRTRQNLGIYRQQVIGPNKVIMRWLAHRGGALDFRERQQANPGQPLPGGGGAGLRSGDHPRRGDAGARYPLRIPFAGLLRGQQDRAGARPRLDLQVPASAEIVLEGRIHPGEMAPEGPYGDHTGYYNEQAEFPVFTIERITMRKDPIYHSTYTGKPPDEPAVLGRGAERGVRAAAAEAVPGDRRFLPAAGGLLVPHGGGQHQEAVPRPRQAASCSASGPSCASSCTPSSSSWWTTTSTSATGRK